MKNLSVMVLIGCISFVITSCEGSTINQSAVPPAVISSFNIKYPGAANTEWKKEKSDGKDVYEAAFKMNEKEIEAEFLPDGTFFKEE